ncbi:pre-toxin TG domain-containing protein [Amycolatopsis sp. VS8301801F10]|uniref:pre-toxin TG domain-containing protein n=1 Tax=Amycolatopsis sp. VS8301801F10 TaxID=2652442 RepID=UPI0038FBE6EE
MRSRIKAACRGGVVGLVVAIVAMFVAMPGPAQAAGLCDRHPELAVCKAADRAKAALVVGKAVARTQLGALVLGHLRQGIGEVAGHALEEAARSLDEVGKAIDAGDVSRANQALDHFREDALQPLRDTVVATSVVVKSLPELAAIAKTAIAQFNALPDLDIHIDVAALEANNRGLAATAAGIAQAAAQLDASAAQIRTAMAQADRDFAGARRDLAAANAILAEANRTLDKFTATPWMPVGGLSLKGITFDFDEAFGHPTRSGSLNPDVKAVLSAVTDVLPGIGSVKSAVEAIAGKDAFTQQELDGFERALYGMAAIPVGGGALKKLLAVERAAKVSRGIELAAKNGSKGWRESFDALPLGKNSGVKTVSSATELRTLFDHWTAGAQKLPPRGDKIPDVFALPDGTTIQWRLTSKSSGETIDIVTADGKRLKVHLDG